MRALGRHIEIDPSIPGTYRFYVAVHRVPKLVERECVSAGGSEKKKCCATSQVSHSSKAGDHLVSLVQG